MGKLLYMNISSLDGYVADEAGKFDWAEPDEEVHTFINDLLRPIGTSLYGRRLYEVMTPWEDEAWAAGESTHIQDFGEIWRGADKVVYSSTLQAPSTARTRLERSFEPNDVQSMKRSVATDLSIGGPTLATRAFAAGLVDECHLFLTPVIVGGGLRLLPEGLQVDREFVEQRRFANGTVYLRYRTI